MPEHSVGLWGGARSLVGAEAVTLEGGTVGALLDDLASRYPDVPALTEDGVAVSIDGVIYQGSRGQPVPEGAEVMLLPRIKGG